MCCVVTGLVSKVVAVDVVVVPAAILVVVLVLDVVGLVVLVVVAILVVLGVHVVVVHVDLVAFEVDDLAIGSPDRLDLSKALMVHTLTKGLRQWI